MEIRRRASWVEYGALLPGYSGLLYVKFMDCSCDE